jgi:hypothetical protein
MSSLIYGLTEEMSNISYGFLIPPTTDSVEIHCPVQFAIFLANAIDEEHRPDIVRDIYKSIFEKVYDGMFCGMSYRTMRDTYIEMFGRNSTTHGLQYPDMFRYCLIRSDCRLQNIYHVCNIAIREADFLGVEPLNRGDLRGYYMLASTDAFDRLFEFSGFGKVELRDILEKENPRNWSPDVKLLITIIGRLYSLGIGNEGFEKTPGILFGFLGIDSKNIRSAVYGYIENLIGALGPADYTADINFEIINRYLLPQFEEAVIKAVFKPAECNENTFPISFLWEPGHVFNSSRIASVLSESINYPQIMLSKCYISRALYAIHQAIEDAVDYNIPPTPQTRKNLNLCLHFLNVATRRDGKTMGAYSAYIDLVATLQPEIGDTYDESLNMLISSLQYHPGFADMIYIENLILRERIPYDDIEHSTIRSLDKILLNQSAPYEVDSIFSLPIVYAFEETLYSGDSFLAWDMLPTLALYIREVRALWMPGLNRPTVDTLRKEYVSTPSVREGGDIAVTLQSYVITALNELVDITNNTTAVEYMKSRDHTVNVPLGSVLEIVLQLMSSEWGGKYMPNFRLEQGELASPEIVAAAESILLKFITISPRGLDALFTFNAIPANESFGLIRTIVNQNTLDILEKALDLYNSDPNYITSDILAKYENIESILTALENVGSKYRNQKTNRAVASRVTDIVYALMFSIAQRHPGGVDIDQEIATEICRAVRDNECGEITDGMVYRECIDDTCESSFGYEAGTRIPDMDILTGDGTDQYGICGVYAIDTTVSFSTLAAVEAVNKFLRETTENHFTEFLSYASDVSRIPYAKMRFHQAPKMGINPLELESGHVFQIYIYMDGEAVITPGVDVFDSEAAELMKVIPVPYRKFMKGSLYKSFSESEKTTLDILMTKIPKPKKISEKLIISNRAADIMRSSACQGWTSCFSIEAGAVCESAPREYIKDNNYIAYMAQGEFSPEWHCRVIILNCKNGFNMAIQTAYGVNDGYKSLIVDAVMAVLYDAAVGSAVRYGGKMCETTWYRLYPALRFRTDSDRCQKCETLGDYSCVESYDATMISPEVIGDVYARRGENFIKWERPLTIGVGGVKAYSESVEGILLQEFIGYRTEACSGETDRSIETTLRYERDELGNTGIPEYVSKTYGITITAMVEMLHKEGYHDCVWLCRDITTVTEAYCHAGDSIDKYYITNAVILSDMEDGVLVAYRDTPEVEENVAIATGEFSPAFEME